MVELACVSPQLAVAVWPLAKPFVRAAVDATNMMTLQEIEDAVLAGRSLLWIALDGTVLIGAVTTELRRTERSLVCIVTSCAAQRLPHDWPHLLTTIENYARAESCSCVRLFGRRGWARKLKASYAQKHVVLERQL